MIISIHQPDYIPYLGYYYKISKSNKFVFLEDCQFSNDNMHNWNRIKTSQGECKLKIPVNYFFGDSINKVKTRDELNWKEKHLKTIKMNYSRSEYFNIIFPKFEEILLRDYDNLADLNIAISTWIIHEFGFKVEIFRSSNMNINTLHEERVIDICNLLNGNVYLSGNGAKAYQIEEHFIKKGVKLIYTDYNPILYKQMWGKNGFLKNLSILDYIFNCGFNWTYVLNTLKEMNQ